MLTRRDFLSTGLAAGTSLALAGVRTTDAQADGGPRPKRSPGRFRLNYAPHFGMFRHHAGDDPLDQLRFMADEGFAGVEDNGLKAKPAGLQNDIGRTLDRLGLTMGVFVGTAEYGRPTFASGRRDLCERVLADLRASIETAKRVNTRWCTVVPGKRAERIPFGQQMAHAVDLLRRCVDLCEPAGLVLLLEPLDHGCRRPQLFLHSAAQAALLCRTVGSPSCRMLFDVYQQHHVAGSLLDNVDRFWNEIGYFQLGDNPGRKEPGTGTIDYRGLFRQIASRGYTGLLGMEHGNSLPGPDGERAVIDAYVRHDALLAPVAIGWHPA